MKKLAGLILLTAVTTNAMSLEEYMKVLLTKNKEILSYNYAIEAAQEKQIAGDLLLSPTLTLGYNVTSDKSQPSTIADKRETTNTNIGLSKKFSTGTSISLAADTSKYAYTEPVTAGNNGYSRGGVGVTLQQSLWKDFFGRGTRLRQDREYKTMRLETLGYELKKRAALIQKESDFWDYVVAQENMKLKQDNLNRAKKLETWTSNRVYNGISDQSDLLQVKALVSLRELELSNAQDELKSISTKVKENLELSENDPIPNLTADLSQTRSQVESLKQSKNIVKIESFLTILESEVKSNVSEETEDSLRPDLQLVGKYTTSAYSTDYSEAQKNITKTDRPITYVGLSVSWMFGSDAKSSQISSAKKDSLASQNKAAQAKVVGVSSWEEHLRKYELTKKNVKTLEKIAEFQRERAKAEQSKFSKGRTITSNVVSAETDSAEAEVNYLKAKSGLRKLEAATQLYISINE